MCAKLSCVIVDDRRERTILYNPADEALAQQYAHSRRSYESLHKASIGSKAGGDGQDQRDERGPLRHVLVVLFLLVRLSHRFTLHELAATLGEHLVVWLLDLEGIGEQAAKMLSELHFLAVGQLQYVLDDADPSVENGEDERVPQLRIDHSGLRLAHPIGMPIVWAHRSLAFREELLVWLIQKMLDREILRQKLDLLLLFLQ